MKTTTVIIAKDIYTPQFDALKQRDGVVFEVAEPFDDNAPLVAEHLDNAEILFSDCVPTNLDAMPNLRVLQIGSAGFEHLLGAGLSERNITACNAAGVFDPTIAEWNLAMMINLVRDLRTMIRNQEAKVWERDARFQRDIRGLNVGIWGYGGIGRATARLCKTLQMTVHVLTRSTVGERTHTYCVPETGDVMGELPDAVFNYDQIEAFLHDLDFLVVAMPLSPATTGIIGEAELRMLPQHAYVLNPARGPLIQESALLTALNDGWIAGAAIDTHYVYPLPSTHPLWQMDNVILTPHISGSTQSPHYQARLWDIFTQNVHRYIAGEPLLNVLTPKQLAGH